MVLTLVVGAAAALRVVLWRPFIVAAPSLPADSRVASGAVHVHTSASDGAETIERVIDAAKAAGLDYVIITDHNGFSAKAAEGYAGDVLVIVGTEISTNTGHLLGFGFSEPTFRFSDDASEVLQDIQDLGGVAVVAHPDTTRPDLRWTAWELPGGWGIELLNGDSQWRAANWFETVRGIASYALNPTYALLSILSPPEQTRDRWDRMLRLRHVSAIAGADAHGFPSYESMFKWAQNHVVLERPLTGDAAADMPAIVSGLRRGRAYMGLDALAPADGFFFVAEQGDRQWTMGDAVPVAPAPRLRAGGNLPREARVSLIHNGQEVAEGAGGLTWPTAAAGVYRVEVHLPGWDVPWILSNAIHVFDVATQEARSRRALIPTPSAPPPTLRVLDNFDGGSSFASASDPSTLVERDILDGHSGADGSGTARLTFTLGAPTSTTPSPFAVLARVGRDDFSGARGLVFSIKGDGAYRVWVQVRDKNSRSADGTEWWYASVKTSRDWRRVALPFARLRTRDPHSDGGLDLKDVRGIFFIVDTGVAKPGTHGRIWVDDVGIY